MAEMIKLGDVATYINGYAFKPEDRGEEGLPIIRIQDLTGNSYDLGFYDGEYPEKIEINDGDVLISWSASLGVYVWNRGKALLNQHIFKVDFDKAEIDKNYFVYAVRRKLDEMASKTHGATMKHIVKKDFDATLIPYPSMGRQAEISNNLDRVSRIIAAREEELQKLDELIKARFVELFGDPCSNPMGHTKMTIKEAVDAGYIEKPLDGNHGEKHPKASEYADDGVPFVMANNLTNGVVDYESCSKITRERADKLDKGFSHDGDVLITHKGTIGRTAIVHTELDYIMLTPQVTYYRPLKGIVAEYLKGYFDTDFFQGEMKKLAAAGGSTRAYVGITNQTQLQLLIPSQGLQTQFADFVKQVDKSKVVAEKNWNIHNICLVA